MKQSRNANHFATGYSFHKMFWLFLIFSIAGFLIEGTYWILRYGHFESRSGLIYGPANIIYGFAVVLMVLLLRNFKDKSGFFIFLIAYLTAVSFELFTSLLEEKFFGFTSWDYSNTQFAILGRANLIYAIFWGLFGVLVIKKLYSKLSVLIEKIPNKAGTIITRLLLLFIIFDFSVSAAAVIRFDQRQSNIPATNFIQIQLDKHYPDERLKDVYSRIESGRK